MQGGKKRKRMRSRRRRNEKKKAVSYELAKIKSSEASA